MKVLFDYQVDPANQYGGIPRYYNELKKGLEEFCGIRCESACWPHKGKYFGQPGNLSQDSFLKGISFRGKKRLVYALNAAVWKKCISKGNYDIFHPTYYNPYFLNCINKKPFVVTAHDMIHELYPVQYASRDKTAEHKKMIFSKAGRIIAVTENTKKDIVRLYKIDEGKIAVVYHGCSRSIICGADKKTIRFKLPEKYILYLGNRLGGKNFVDFLKAVSFVLKKDGGLFMVCAGGGAFWEYEKDLISGLSLQDKVLRFDVDDAELGYLYKHAVIFVYPSVYEGFGLPIVEAFACGCPAALSKASCFPEIAGDAAEYFDPLSIDSMRNTIESVIDNQGKRKVMIEKGAERAKNFTWQRTAERTKDVYMSVI